MSFFSPSAPTTRLNETISALENRMLELQNKLDARQAEWKNAEAVTLKNVEEAAVKSSDRALDRVMKLVDYTRNILILLLVLAAAAGFGGYLQIQSLVKEFAIAQVKSWLNVTETSSPLHAPLSRLTTRVAVDALIMDRARYGTRTFGLGELKITAAWIDKILADLFDAATSDTDFADLALALASEAPMMGGGEHRGHIIEALQKGLLAPQTSAYRKAVIFRTFGFDPALTDVAIKLFQTSDNIEVQSAAFRYLRLSISAARLAVFAEPIVNSALPDPDGTQRTLKVEAAEVLAEANPKNAELARFLRQKDRSQGVAVENAIIGLAALKPIATKSDLNFQAVSDAEQKLRLNFAVPLMAAAIKSGAAICWSDNYAGHPVIALQIKDKNRAAYYPVPAPTTLLTAALGNALLGDFGRDGAGLSMLVRAVSGSDAHKENFGHPYRIQLVLNDQDSVTTTSGEVLSKARIGNPIFLERDLENDPAVLMRWRDAGGVFKLAYLDQASLGKAVATIVAASAGSDNYIANYAYNATVP